MKRAVVTHEKSALPIQYLLLKEQTESGNLHATVDITIKIEIENRNRTLQKVCHVEFERKFMKFEESLTSVKFEALVGNNCKKTRNNEILEFLLVYIRML